MSQRKCFVSVHTQISQLHKSERNKMEHTFVIHLYVYSLIDTRAAVSGVEYRLLCYNNVLMDLQMNLSA